MVANLVVAAYQYRDKGGDKAHFQQGCLALRWCESHAEEGFLEPVQCPEGGTNNHASANGENAASCRQELREQNRQRDAWHNP